MPRIGLRSECKTYNPTSAPDSTRRVLVVSISKVNHVLGTGKNTLHEAIRDAELDLSIGLYFYRFKTLSTAFAFTKIGEVSQQGGIARRKKRGWLGTATYPDTYLGKIAELDVRAATSSNPMYFIFYEFSVEDSFPKIDELYAFDRHRAVFGRLPRNKESPNKMPMLGRNLVFHTSAFDEVYNLRYQSGENYSV